MNRRMQTPFLCGAVQSADEWQFVGEYVLTGLEREGLGLGCHPRKREGASLLKVPASILQTNMSARQRYTPAASVSTRRFKPPHTNVVASKHAPVC